jgi:hypothetical protein
MTLFWRTDKWSINLKDNPYHYGTIFGQTNQFYIFLTTQSKKESRDGAVGIATGYGMDDRGVGVRVPVGVRIFTSCRPDRLWSPSSFITNGYCTGTLKWQIALHRNVRNRFQFQHANNTTLKVLVIPHIFRRIISWSLQKLHPIFWLNSLPWRNTTTLHLARFWRKKVKRRI